MTKIANQLCRAAATGVVAPLVAVGFWAVHTPGAAQLHDHPAGPAAVGQDVRVKDALVRVERAADEEIGAMPMPMSGPGMTEHGSGGKMPMVPKGMRRVGVELTVHAPRSSHGIALRERDFSVAAARLAPTPPVADDSTRGFVPAGTSLTSTLAFNVPRSARAVQLRVRGAERPISLTLAPAPAQTGGHHH
jgi:hypothetical protein